MRRVILISLAAVVALFGFGSKVIGQTVKVGAVVPLTGRYAALGGQVKAGYEIAVPLFITTGEKVKVDTRDGSYLGRVTA